MSRAINVILTENQAQTLSSVPPIFLFHPYLAASLEASLCHYLSEEPRLLLASPGPLSQMSQRAASTPYKAWTILFYCKHHPAERCDLRFGSKRTEKLKSHEAQPSVISIFPCALKAKSQITPLRRVMFAINTTTWWQVSAQSVL